MTDRVLVTGGTGFVGNWIVRELLAYQIPVIVLTRVRSYEPAPPVTESMVECVDITDYESLVRVVRERSVKNIVHAAAVVAGSSAASDSLASVNTNVGGTANVLEAARAVNARRVIYISSGSAYGVRSYRPQPLAEDEAPVQPLTNTYACTKLLGEQLCLTYAAAYGVSGAIVRLSRVFGPGRDNQVRLPIDDLVRDAISSRRVTVTPSMGTPVDHTYVKDVARGIRMLLEAPLLPHSLYNLSGGMPSNGEQIVRVLAAIFPDLEVLHVEPNQDPSPHPYHRPPLDIHRIREAIGFVPMFDLQTAVADYIRELGQQPVGNDE